MEQNKRTKDNLKNETPTEAKSVLSDSYIISIYKESEGVSYIVSSEDGFLFKTWIRSKAKLFSSAEEAEKYKKDNEHRWRKGYKVEKL